MKKRLQILLTLSLVVLTISCDSEDSSDSNLVQLNFNQKHQIQEFTIEFDSVLSDSRCPTGLECVWEGNAEVQFNYTNNKGTDFDFILNTNSSFKIDTLINGRRIKLINVLPHPEKDKIIDKNDYKVELEIE